MVFYNTCLLFNLFSVQKQVDFRSDVVNLMGPFIGPLGPGPHLGPELECLSELSPSP